MLENPFKFPDFTNDSVNEESKVVFNKTDSEEAKEYLALVKKELENTDNKKLGDAKRRYYEATVNWVHNIIEDDVKKDIDKAAAVYKNVHGLVRGAENERGNSDKKLIEDLKNRTG